MNRIFGIETEFGCWADAELFPRPEDAVEVVKDHAFYDQRIGLIDLHARDDVFEPVRSGGFLVNGARLYVDAVGSHLEYATAECRNLKDVIANDRAGHRMITKSIRDLGLEDAIRIYNNSVDHFGGHTFGCHENYLCQMDEDFFATRVGYLIPFLVTRQIYAGVGRVGGHKLGDFGQGVSREELTQNPIDYIWVSNVYDVAPDATVDFQLSQRADHILKVVASRVRFNRALINPKWEHFYALGQKQRLHLLFGESNQCEFAYALKVGTTSLVLRAVEEGLEDETFVLANPLRALRDVSRDLKFQVELPTAVGDATTAIQLQRRYLELCSRYQGSDPDTDWTLEQWKWTLDQLESDPNSLYGYLDWVTKRKIVEDYRDEEKLGPKDDALHTVDLEYHNIDPEQSLFHAVQDMGETKRLLHEVDIIEALTDSPKNTRAFGRSEMIKKILANSGRLPYAVDWNGVGYGRGNWTDLHDPFDSYASAAEQMG